MKPIIDAVDKIIYKIYRSKHPVLAELMNNWINIVGNNFSANSAPLKISSNFDKGKKINTLYISVENSAISLTMAYQQELIIERIAVYLGYKAIHKIKILVRE